MEGATDLGVLKAQAPVEASKVARNVIHRFNNFLALLVVHGETALTVKDASTMDAALRAILEESKQVEAYMRQSRRGLGE